MQSPSTPTMGSLMGRIKAFGKSTKRQASETAGVASPGGAAPAAPAEAGAAEVGVHVFVLDLGSVLILAVVLGEPRYPSG